jgi:lysyl-tRNA synthetase class 2
MSSQEEQIQQRRANLQELAKLGVEIYPRRFTRKHTVADLVAAHGERTHDDLEAERPDTVTAGRILAIRSFGKASFLAISDGRAKIQIYIRRSISRSSSCLISATGSGSRGGCSARGRMS